MPETLGAMGPGEMVEGVLAAVVLSREADLDRPSGVGSFNADFDGELVAGVEVVGKGPADDDGTGRPMEQDPGATSVEVRP